MDVRTKTLISLVLVGVIIGAFTLQITNKGFFKGQIFGQPTAEDENTVTTDNAGSETTLPPDLKPELKIIVPDKKDEDLKVNVTIKNSGKGSITKGKPFKYAIYVNDKEVFSNSDSYTEMLPNDAFNFEYPISKAVYNYGDQGKIKLVVDVENTIKEENEENNKIELDYKY